MYAVSEQFKTAVKSPKRKSTIRGTLTTKNGNTYQLDDSSLIKETLYVTNQIVNDNKLCFGAVYAGECGLVINSTIDRYSLFGAKIELTFALKLADGTEESISLGVFFVDTAERIGSKINLTAIDCMSNFDVSVNEDVNGTWYELYSYICNKCGVEMAQTQEELEALHVNATNQNYTIQQARIDTYRDVLSYLCMVVCANATIDNTGKIKIVQYATTPCDSNDRSTRMNNCKFNDYTTRYYKVTARFIAEENYAPYEAINPDIPETDGLTLDMGDIPIVGGTVDSKHETMDAIMETLKQIVYVPTTLYIASNPAYELGDMITCNAVNNTVDSLNTYVMAYRYDYRKKETINCYGDNPLLQNIKDKNRFDTSDLESQIAAKDMIIVTATNVQDITIKQDLNDIVTLNFSVNTDCRPICLFTVPFSIDLDGYVEFSLYNGLVAIENAVYNGYYEKGEHFATFVYLDDMKQDERRSMRVLVRCYADVTSAIRTQDARIKTLENRAIVPLGDIFPQDKSMWEVGGLANTDGADIENTARLKSYFVPIVGGQRYKCVTDASHSLVTRHYTSDKAYRGTTTDVFVSADFEFTTDATDKYIRFVMKNNDDTDITADALDSTCWTCEPVIDVEDVAVDTTEPTVTIKTLAVKAIIYAQGINSGGGDWDGTLEFIDNFKNEIPLIDSMSVVPFNSDVAISQLVPVPAEIAEAFGEIALNNTMSVVGFTDSVTTGQVILGYTFDATNGEYDSDYVTADGAYMLKTEYKYTSTEQTIDSGKMCSVAIDYTGLTVESVVVESEQQ